MKNLESLQKALYKKELNFESLVSVQGGYTLTGCSSSGGNESTCTDKDKDPPNA